MKVHPICCVHTIILVAFTSLSLLPPSIQIQAALSLPRSKSNSKFKPLVKIRASKTITQPIPDQHEFKESLQKYMQLPASQYTCVPMPLNSSLTRIKGTKDQFRLTVPPISLKSPGVPLVEVSPIVFAQVLVDKNEVRITSDKCIIEGSQFIQDFHINDFFEFKVNVLLTWNDNINDNVNHHHHHHHRGQHAVIDAGDDASFGGPFIRAQSEIEIDLDPPGPFAFVPKQILEAVGNRAIQMTLGALQKNFMMSLGEDFERWVVDGEYQMERQQLELDFLKEEIDMQIGNGNGNHRGRGGQEVELDETLLAYLNR